MSRDVLQDYGAARLVVVCSFLNNFLLEGNVRSFGFLYRDIIGRFEGSASGTAWIKATYSLCATSMGPVTVILLERYGYRCVVVVGCLIQAAALLASAFATSILYLYVSYGVLSGLGGGLIYVTKAAIVNRHFDRYRGRALSVAMVGGPIGVAVFSQAISSLLDSYAYRGTMFILAGLALNHCVAAFLYMPSLQRVRKKDPLLGGKRAGGEEEELEKPGEEKGDGDGKLPGSDRDERKVMTDFDEMQCEALLVREQGIGVGEEGNDEKTRDNISAETGKGNMHECMSTVDESTEVRPTEGKVNGDGDNITFQIMTNGSSSNIHSQQFRKGEVNKDNLDVSHVNEDICLKNPNDWFVSTSSGIDLNLSGHDKTAKHTRKLSFKLRLNVGMKKYSSVLRNVPYLFYCVHMFTMPFAIGTIYMFIPSLAAERGFSPDKLALPMVIICVASIVGGLLSGPVFDVTYIRSRVDLFEALIGLLLGLSVILLGVFGVSITTFLSLSCLYGFLEGSICTQRSNAVFGYVRVEQFPLALGVATFFQGVGNFVSPALLGLSHDMSGTYVYCFVFGGATMAFTSSILIITHIYVRNSRS